MIINTIDSLIMKKFLIVVAITTAVCISGYLFIRLVLLKKKNNAPSPQPVSGLDLRPLMINKIADLVKSGSNGLYNVQIEKLDIDILKSTADLYNVSVIPDSAAILKLDSLRQLPDDILKVYFSSLHITNISPLDLLHKDRISVDSIVFASPQLEIYHKTRPYNKAQHTADTTQTLYQKLTKQFKSISIKAVIGTQGTFTYDDISDDNKKRVLNNVKLNITDLLVDPSTQHNKDRVLFSKGLTLSAENYVSRSADSLYEFRIRYVGVDAVRHTIIANDADLLPRGTIQQFEQKLKHIGDRFTLHFPKLEFMGVRSWQLINNENFICENAAVYDAEIDDYLDRSLPHSTGGITVKNFPQQLLKSLSLKINIKTLDIHNANVVYEEFAPETEQVGKVSFNNINGSISNMTNMPDAIKKNSFITATANAMFMKTVPLKAVFAFDLLKPSGDFSADLQTGKLDSSVLNPITIPLGLIEMKKGLIVSGSAHLRGNNYGDSATVLMLFNDLHLVPLKKESSGDGIRKKPLLSFIANTFILKKDNPPGSAAAVPVHIFLPRGSHGNFFNFAWSSMRKGILKTLNVPGNK